MDYTKAARAAALPWNQRREQRAAASTSEFGRPAACLNSRPKHRLELTDLNRCGALVCATGVCHTCECGLISGSVKYDPEPLEPPAAGNLLICCSRPRHDRAIDI